MICTFKHSVEVSGVIVASVCDKDHHKQDDDKSRHESPYSPDELRAQTPRPPVQNLITAKTASRVKDTVNTAPAQPDRKYRS